MKIITKCDTVFSKLVRHKYADEEGRVKCYTCNTKAPIAMMTLGHYQKRRHMGTRFHEVNCKPQCYTCQLRCEEGLLDDKFRALLVQEHGEEKVAEVEARARDVYHFSTSDLEELYEELNREFKNLKQKKDDESGLDSI